MTGRTVTEGRLRMFTGYGMIGGCGCKMVNAGWMDDLVNGSNNNLKVKRQHIYMEDT